MNFIFYFFDTFDGMSTLKKIISLDKFRVTNNAI